MKYYKRINGEHLYLASISTDDAPVFSEWLSSDDEDCKKMFGTYKNDKVINQEIAEGVLDSMIYDFSFSIVDRETNQLLGYAGFNNASFINQRINVWININTFLEQEKQIQYGSETINLLLEYAYNFLNVHNVILEAQAFDQKLIEIIKASKAEYFGKKTGECRYSDGLFYDKLFFQCTPQIFYGEKRDTVYDYSSSGSNIILPNNTMSNIIVGEEVSLIRYSDNPETLSIFTEFLSHDEISVPFGYHKENLHESKSKLLLQGITYAVISDGKFVGSIKLNVDDYDKSGNLEIIIGKPSNGYGRASLGLLLEEIYRTGFLNNFSSNVFGFNEKSIGLHEKLGYRFVGNRKEAYFANGKLNDILFYEQTYEQYNKKK